MDTHTTASAFDALAQTRSRTAARTLAAKLALRIPPPRANIRDAGCAAAHFFTGEAFLLRRAALRLEAGAAPYMALALWRGWRGSALSGLPIC